jgi:sRNA-binding carbon storage regulator CsrA
MMLVIKRRTNETITIEPVNGSDTAKTVGELFSKGVIEITLLEVVGNQVKFGISAPGNLQIWRGHAHHVVPRKDTVALAKWTQPASGQDSGR